MVLVPVITGTMWTARPLASTQQRQTPLSRSAGVGLSAVREIGKVLAKSQGFLITTGNAAKR